LNNLSYIEIVMSLILIELIDIYFSIYKKNPFSTKVGLKRK